MKKLFTLALVLSVASLASAALDLGTIDGLSYQVTGNTVTISSTLGVSGYTLALEGVGGSVTGVAIPAGFVGTKTPGSDTGAVWDGLGASIGDQGAPVTGAILSINFTPGTALINFAYSSAAYDVSAINIGGNLKSLEGYSMTIVPEPMTMGLLGLGSLFLARRKK